MSSAAELTSKGRTWWVSVVFYGVLTVLMVAILTDTLADVMPAHLAERIGFNSEGYLFALLLGAYIQFGLAQLREELRGAVAIALGVACGAIGIGLLSSNLPAAIKTLNETWVALALLIPYVTWRRPLGAWAPISSMIILAAVVIAVPRYPDSFVVDFAEAFGFWVLMPIALDVVDRGILNPHAVTNPRARYSWYALLVAIPGTVVLLGVGDRNGSGVHAVLDYLGRIHESFIGTLAIVLFFAVGLGRVGQHAVADPAEAEGPTARDQKHVTAVPDPTESTPGALPEGTSAHASDFRDE